jgi:hypothetical protein
LASISVRASQAIVAGGPRSGSRVLSLLLFGIDGNIAWYQEWVVPYLNSYIDLQCSFVDDTWLACRKREFPDPGPAVRADDVSPDRALSDVRGALADLSF